MTAAQRTARACQAGAFLSAASAGYSLTWHPWYALAWLDARDRVECGEEPPPV